MFGCIVLIAIATLPESPQYYYTKGRFDETRAVLNQIAAYNGVSAKFDNMYFDTEVKKVDAETTLETADTSMN